MLKILFQGDSITDGNRYKEESSRWDLNHQIGHSWAYIVAASLGYRFPMRFDFVNRAVSGNTVLDLNARWQQDTLAEKPDVICLLVGINDCNLILKGENGLSCEKYQEGLNALFDRALAANPSVRFIVLEPFCDPDSDARAACMDQIRKIARETALRYHALFIPLQPAFDERMAEGHRAYWLWDKIHPTEAGHGLIADAFLKASETLLLSLSEKKYRLCIFDLDGTILDTLEDLKDSVNYALGCYGYPERTLGEIRQFVGNGMGKLIERAVPQGTASAQTQKVFEAFTAFYKTHNKVKTKPYEGILEVLLALRRAGMKTAVVSNKGDALVQSLVQECFPGCFDDAVGEKENIRRKPAPDSANEVLRVLNVPREAAVFIGDSDVDIETAKNAGLDHISVTWGFRDRAVLEQAGGKTFAEKPQDILTILGI